MPDRVVATVVGRAILLLLSFMLSLSMATGAVAHAAEGTIPLEHSYIIDDCADANQSSPQDEDQGLPHFHMCHGHQVGVPLLTIAVPIPVAPRYLHRASVHQPLSSIRLRAPQEPPRA